MALVNYRVAICQALVLGSLANSVALGLGSTASAGVTTQPEEYINVLGGTANTYDMSRGNILPEATLPWGFNGWAPETGGVQGSADDPYTILGERGGFWFYSKAYRIFGMRLTHQPSPWTGDYGNMRFMTHIVDDSHTGVTQYSAYDPRKSDWRPYYQKHTLLAYCGPDACTTMELTPTEHGAVMRFTFPPQTTAAVDAGWNQTRRILVAMNPKQNDGKSWKNDSVANPAPGVMTGVTTRCDNDENTNFAHYFHLTVSGGVHGDVAATPFSVSLDGAIGIFDYTPTDVAGDTLTLRVATSLISPAQAEANHKAEVDGVAFDAAVAAAKAAWHDVAKRMSIVDVGAGYNAKETEDWKGIFYSSLYRAAKYPRKLWETDHATGKPIHWSPYTGKIVPGKLSSDQGFWDAYRTTYSWLALIRPERFAETMAGWLSSYDEAGWVPQWAHPGGGGGMTGTLSDVALSEAIVKLPHCAGTSSVAATHAREIPAFAKSLSDGVDPYCVNASGLYTASRKNAFEMPGKKTVYGRVCLDNYTALGYIPLGCSDATVSRSMNYWHSDYALSVAATVLNKTAEASELLLRSEKWTTLFNPKTKFFQTKHPNGSFSANFDEFAWGPEPGFTEAGPWQYRFEVPYDPASLKAALINAGAADPCDLIQTANTMSSAFHMGGYGSEIHEMSEMAINCWGQWELNNQPVWALEHMQIGFDTSVTGKCANQAQKWLRQSNDMLSNSDEMYPGDEDNGSMGAWFIFNMLGLYPLSPASGDYVIGVPLFANVTLDVGAPTPLAVVATNQAPANVYVQSLTWNGKPVTGVTMKYADLMQGGVLQFAMGPSPAGEKREL